MMGLAHTNYAPCFAHAHAGLNGGSPPDWRVDDNELAADFDGSFAGLGVDLAGIPYNMR